MIILTNRLEIKTIDVIDKDDYVKYIKKIKNFIEEWEPKRDKDYYEGNGIRKEIENKLNELESKKGYTYCIYLKGKNEIIGTITINNIVYGPFLSCFLGYKLSEKYLNNGYMTEALDHIIKIAFNDIGLHRIEANVMPRNIRSQKVLEKLGFTYEGLSRKYLKINNKWEDHEHYVILNEMVE